MASTAGKAKRAANKSIAVKDLKAGRKRRAVPDLAASPKTVTGGRPRTFAIVDRTNLRVRTIPE